MTKDEAMKLALEALMLNNDEWKSLADSGDSGYWKAEDQDHYQQTNKAITALREALAQPEQEPVEWLTGCPSCGMDSCDCDEGTWNPPTQRKPLTDEQIETIWRRVQANDFHDCVQPFARAIEAAHGIKENT